ncbi:site-specific integrase [Sinorhizobium fredii]|uniref:site-specific integrase n=1 Tax=Rhizobium fredii TaxID=380 RepID=UPI0004BB3AF6|nr:site-specific integrase [Sinorhizobium fredii]
MAKNLFREEQQQTTPEATRRALRPTRQEVLADRAKYKPGSVLWISAGAKLAKLEGKRIEDQIPDCSGLYLISQPSGKQSWAYRYRRPQDGKAYKLTLGKVDMSRKLEPGEEPDFDDDEGLTKDMAVNLASWCRMQVKAKRDPAVTKQQRASEMEHLKRLVWEGYTVDTLFVEFMQNYPPVRAGRSATDSTKRLTAGFLGLKPDGKGSWQPNGNGVLSKWQGKVFATRDGTPKLTRRPTIDILKEMKPVVSNRTLSALKLFGKWAVVNEYVNVNPFEGIPKQFGEEERDRTLKPDEIKALWNVVETAKEGDAVRYPYGRIAQLILATGQRPGEVLAATWSEFDFAEQQWTIPRQRTKNRKADFVVPLSELAFRVLATLPDRGNYLFASVGSNDRPANKETAKHRFGRPVADQLGRPVEHFTYHDLRRTAYTAIMEDSGWMVADMVTNHAPPKMAQTYGSGANLDRWKREALDAWGKRLREIIGS